MVDQVVLSLTNVMGLVFIFVGLGLLGPIKLAFITSSRKAISVLASIIAFNKHIDVSKMIGIGLIMSGMIAENIFKDKKGGGHHGHQTVKHSTDTADHVSSPKLDTAAEVEQNLKNRDHKKK